MPTSSPLWKFVRRPYLQTIASSYPDHFAELLKTLPPSSQQGIESLPGSTVMELDVASILEKMEQLPKNQQTVNILIEIQRPIQTQVEQSTFLVSRETGETQEGIEIHSSIRVPTALDFEYQDEIKITDTFLKIIKKYTDVLNKNADSKIRVILGGFPNHLTADLSLQLMQMLNRDNLFQHANRIVFSFHNRTDNIYFDKPLLR